MLIRIAENILSANKSILRRVGTDLRVVLVTAGGGNINPKSVARSLLFRLGAREPDGVPSKMDSNQSVSKSGEFSTAFTLTFLESDKRTEFPGAFYLRSSVSFATIPSLYSFTSDEKYYLLVTPTASCYE